MFVNILFVCFYSCEGAILIHPIHFGFNFIGKRLIGLDFYKMAVPSTFVQQEKNV